MHVILDRQCIVTININIVRHKRGFFNKDGMCHPFFQYIYNKYPLDKIHPHLILIFEIKLDNYFVIVKIGSRSKTSPCESESVGSSLDKLHYCLGSSTP